MKQATVFLMAIFLLAGCASQGEMVKIGGEQKAISAKTDNNFRVVAKALTDFEARIKKLETVPAPQPVRDDKGQFTPAATNVPKADPVVTPAPLQTPVKPDPTKDITVTVPDSAETKQ